MGHRKKTNLQGFPEFFGQVMVVRRSTSPHPTGNDNVLSADSAALVACIMFEHLLNIPRIIATEIREYMVKENTTLPFSSLIYQICMDSGVPVFPDIDHMITNIRKIEITLIKDDLNPVAR
ncbi:hypothetical protein HAX54_045722, partial [Datura stramonium]|nr:hypothetical protein [Datura stramonium]